MNTIHMQRYPAFVPDWIVKVLRRNGLKLEDLLYFERIRPFFAHEDLASLVCCYDLSSQFIGVDVCGDIHSWEGHWVANATDATSKQSIQDILALSYADKTKADTLARLAQTPSESRYEEKRESFKVELVGDFGVYVILNSGFTTDQRVVDQFKITQCILKKLYVYEEHHDLMSRPLGQRYIESLLQ